jgi:uncharacterized protein (DUF362 family)/NAD-dependent dihydropyrimidine dehydrogenase PreA subunit
MIQVSIKRATYSDLFVEPLLEPLGGIRRFVNEGEKVLLKVNLLSAREPKKAVTTHPEFVRAVAKEVRRAGGKPFVGDSLSGTFSARALKKAYERCGLEKMAREENIPLNYDTGSRKLETPRNHRLKRTTVCNFALEADKIIALPKLKTHSFQFLTLACKIMYGVIPGLTKAGYHARFPSRAAFADILLDVFTLVRPRLFVMDGVIGMQGQGPASGDPVELGWVVASEDPVAMDIAVCEALGIEPVGIPVLKRAKIRGLWPERIQYPCLRPTDIAHAGFKLPNTADHLLTGSKAPSKSPLITEQCIGCGDCETICPKGAVRVADKLAKLNYSKCIRCYCCHEVCPENAIKLGTVRKRGIRNRP